MMATEVPDQQRAHPLLRALARVISVLFHPLFVPLYLGWFFIFVLRLFPQLDEWNQTKLLISFAVNYTLLPLITILLAKALGFVQSVQLKTQKDRIIPYIATGVFYFWVWYVFKNQGYPKEVVLFSLGVFLSSSVGLLLNSYFKVSMHTLAAGVVLALFVVLGLRYHESMGLYISIAVLLTGLVCTARLVNEDHSPKEVYAGLLAGALSLLLAAVFVL